MQENDLQKSAISTEAYYLILKARQLDQAVVGKIITGDERNGFYSGN